MRTIARPAGDGVRLIAADGLPLAADLFAHASARAVALVAPAMGVPRRLYAPFAAYLADGGIATLTLDCRGIGGSRPRWDARFDARLSDWAELDLSAAARFLRARFPPLPLYWIGHSCGGQLMGLCPSLPIERALFFASQSGHWRLWNGWRRLAMAGLWYALIPAATALRGYFPMRALGGGEDLPRGVATQWAEWGRRRDYILPFARARLGDAAFSYAGPLRAYAFADDAFAPARAVEALLALYRRAAVGLRSVAPADVHARAIGHFGVFRSQFRDTIWREARDWLLA